VICVRVFQAGGFGPDQVTKYFGPQRLRLHVGLAAGKERHFAFLYYFEKFGTVTLPLPDPERECGREGAGDPVLESTRS
jgi:hypothetical protein